jgi:hypothetical protein
VRLLRRAALGLGLALAAGLLLWFGGLGPRAFLPGGWLWGELREPPADWSFTDRVAEIQLQTQVAGFLPWSVTTWVLSHQGRLFVAASDCDRVWTNRVKRDPRVRLRIEGVVYELEAFLETDRALGEALAPMVLAKYFGIGVESARFAAPEPRGCVFRLEPRS